MPDQLGNQAVTGKLKLIELVLNGDKMNVYLEGAFARKAMEMVSVQSGASAAVRSKS